MNGALAFVVAGDPPGKPRMTRRDRWARRPAVLSYRAWADRARLAAAEALGELMKARQPPGTVRAVAYFAMPASWRPKLRAEMVGKPHRVKPDSDNVAKALLDALTDRDQVIHEIHILKRWDDGAGPRLEVWLEA